VVTFAWSNPLPELKAAVGIWVSVNDITGSKGVAVTMPQPGQLVTALSSAAFVQI